MLVTAISSRNAVPAASSSSALCGGRGDRIAERRDVERGGVDGVAELLASGARRARRRRVACYRDRGAPAGAPPRPVVRVRDVPGSVEAGLHAAPIAGNANPRGMTPTIVVGSPSMSMRLPSTSPRAPVQQAARARRDHGDVVALVLIERAAELGATPRVPKKSPPTVVSSRAIVRVAAADGARIRIMERARRERVERATRSS